ncbi:hypothetical protein B0T18DRAFT_467953 [Schizothecium vesticola]|uniref:Dynamin N-terminal domain-containing protein n=1 Tax=Schizothecium vesticola TaxID=314040 RepID=A0AA40EPB8_9PEZI|nr:hypothetical protein B0T18DRAFT_467953 [Schizothecium vesticola]
MATKDNFPWENVSQVKDHSTMKRLESTCDMGGYYAAKLAHRIIEANLDDPSFDASEMTFLRKCLAEKATGAGKSTLLNALLDCEGLLSSSDSSASTATICEVGYNSEEDPDKAFRCDVFYRDEADVRRELDAFFRDLQSRKELLEACLGKEGGGHQSEEAWEEAVKEFDSNIQCVLDKILAIWGRTIYDLDGMSTDDLLRADDPAMDFIRLQKQTFYGHDMSDFSEKIQRYLDSSQSEMEVARRKGWAQKMSLWPLIKMVKLYVKADILKSSIVLVDLPGLSDVVGARAQLAEEYYGKLDVTMVVTPVVRGADEMTGVDLMSRNQALNMKMDGKFDHKSFCVVLSKADVTDWPQSDRPSMPMVRKVNAEGNKLRAEMARVKKEIKSLKKRRAKSKQKAQGLALNAKLKEAQKALKTCRATKKHHARGARAKLGTANFNYRQARDKHQFTRISKMLQQQHKSMRERSRSSLPTEFKDPRIFSVGTKAYWCLKSGKYVEGYPTIRYTGIPELRQWLKEVTIPIREKITVAPLKEYQKFYNSLQTWSDNLCMVRRVKFSAEEFEEHTLNPMLEELQGLLKAELRTFERNIRNCDPLLGYTAAIEKCQQELCEVVQSWARRYPSNKNRLQLLNHMTFGAIIRRNGGPFTSNAGGKKTYYHWMEDLATLFNSQILGNWVKQLHEEIPKEVQLFRESTDKTWEMWQERLVLAISRNSPDIEGRHLAQQAAKLSVIKEEFKNSVSDTVGKFVARSPKVSKTPIVFPAAPG